MLVRAWTLAHSHPDASPALSSISDNARTVCALTPCMHTAQVELPWRALLPPGVDDLVLAIHDDEPTSIVAYFLATR